MMKFRSWISQVLILLLIGIGSVYGATIGVGIYGSYDFNNKNLSIFWKSADIYDSYEIVLSKVIRTGDVNSCNFTLSYSTINTATVLKSTRNITFTNVINDRVLVSIYGIVQTSKTKIQEQEFYILPISKSVTISWCNGTPSEIGYTFIGTEIYSTKTPSFEFGETVVLHPDTRSETERSSSSNYFEVNNMIFVSKLKNNTDATKFTYSPISAQVIVYTIVPESPVWEGITQ